MFLLLIFQLFYIFLDFNMLSIHRIDNCEWLIPCDFGRVKLRKWNFSFHSILHCIILTFIKLTRIRAYSYIFNGLIKSCNFISPSLSQAWQM